MKKLIFIKIALTFFTYSVFAQNNYSLLEGTWEFVPIEGSNDTTFKVYSCFNKNKQLQVFFWKKSKTADTYGNPYTYYGFWDTSPYSNTPLPKQILELKSTGRYILFYDDLILNDNQKNKIGYDRLGNLFLPTRQCDWGIHENELKREITIELNFNAEPDLYKKVDKIPDYILASLKKNKEHWQKYLDFVGHKELKIKALKSLIYLSPDKQSKMYLTKGDYVEILEEKNEWLKIRYYGKKTVEGWIKKSDVEAN